MEDRGLRSAFFSKFRDESGLHTLFVSGGRSRQGDGEEMDVTLWGFLLTVSKITSRKNLGFVYCLTKGQFEGKG